MIVIIDGPRGVGKTTTIKLVENLLREEGLKVAVFKAERGDDPWLDMRSTVAELVANHEYDVFLIDRFHFTEAVMRIADGTENPTEMRTMVHLISDHLSTAGAMTILMNADNGALVQRVSSRADGRGDENPNAYTEWQKAIKFGLTYCPDVYELDTTGLTQSRISMMIRVMILNKLRLL